MMYSLEPHLDALEDDALADIHWYALIDAQDPHMLTCLQAVINDCPHVLLFATLFADDALPLSPRLLVLSGDPTERRAQLVQLSGACEALPVLSLLCSHHDLAALNAHLQSLLRVQAGEQEFLLRLADTQMLAATLRVMTPAQTARVMRGIRAWWTVDHRGQLQNLARSLAQGINAPASVPLEFTADQTLALVDNAELTILASQLRETEGSFAALPHAAQIGFVDNCLSGTRVSGMSIDDPFSLVQQAWATRSPAPSSTTSTYP